MAHCFMVAGTTRGVGKTMFTLGLVGALVRRGLKVQPFKAGPDSSDPTSRARAAGVPSRTPDTWLVLQATIVELFARTVRGRDIAVVDGVMGLSDSPLLRTGQQVSGHEFPWSRLGQDVPPADAAHDVIDQGGQREGFRRGSLLASYVDRHLASEARGAGRWQSGEVRR